jgi:cyclophilin family peptidyl-prolyl cis-trans isomerase
MPVIDDSVKQAAGSFGSIADSFKQLASITKKAETTQDGLRYDKTLLRIHVYDAAAETAPSLSVFGLDTKDDGPVILPKEAGLTTEDQTIKKQAENPKIKNNFNWWKTIIASRYPTIIHGNSSSVIKSLNISSNVTGDVRNTKIVEAAETDSNRQFADELEEEFDESTMFPSSLVIQMMGNPLINRGAQFFVDFKTSTSLDNIYAVNSITHSIQPGDFTTTLNCVTPNMNIVSSARSDYLNRAKDLE